MSSHSFKLLKPVQKHEYIPERLRQPSYCHGIAHSNPGMLMSFQRGLKSDIHLSESVPTKALITYPFKPEQSSQNNQ